MASYKHNLSLYVMSAVAIIISWICFCTVLERTAGIGRLGLNTIYIAGRFIQSNPVSVFVVTP